jgi:hypothetical protein
MRVPFFPTSLPAFVVGVLDDGYSNRCEVESYCGFDLHFLWPGMVSIVSCVFGLLDFFL